MRKKSDRVFNLVTVENNNNGDPALRVYVMSEAEAKAWIANHGEEQCHVIFDGVQYKTNTEVTFEPVDAPAQQPTEKPKRKYTRKPKVAPVVANAGAEKVREILDAKNGASSGEERRQ